MQCGEGFAGAQERKSQREADSLIGAVGNALGMLTGNSEPLSRSDRPPPRQGTSRGGRGGSDDDGGDPPPMES